LASCSVGAIACVWAMPALIRGLDRDRVRQALVSAMVQFARDASAGFVAEGIEWDAERDVLRGLGVPYGQGYLLTFSANRSRRTAKPEVDVGR
jgi:EAL domain-containing protein (putative c-di-GMP-specific phosphodiesterase class I)